MKYDTQTRCFIFDNKAKAKPNAMLFYDLPKLMSDNEEICPELQAFAERLPQQRQADIFEEELIEPEAKEHQIDPIRWAIRANGIGILAYGMGLGKTFIAIRSCIHLKRKRVLIVCLSHLKHNWKDEISKWSDGRSFHICEGRSSEQSATAWATIINKDILADNLETLLSGEKFDQLVVDECHKCGGWGTKTYKALVTISKDIRKRNGGVLLLTGTLFKNSPMDAYTALYLLDQHITGPRGAFEMRFDPIGHRKQEIMGLMRRGNAPRWLIAKKWGEVKALEKEHGKNGDVAGLRWLLSQYAISKKYKDVFPDDGKTRKTQFVSVKLDLSDKQRRTLEKGAMLDGGKIEAELSTILRLVAEQKAPFVAEYVEEWLDNNDDQKIVIATWHISARDLIKAELQRFGVVEISGTPKQKSKAELAFREDPLTRVCLINLESGGTGLNLVSASELVFSEVPWTSASFEQVKARIDRIGQDAASINYTVFIAADTPEGAKFGTLQKKAALNDRYLN